jgi:hypothetical protein
MKPGASVIAINAIKYEWTMPIDMAANIKMFPGPTLFL